MAELLSDPTHTACSLGSALRFNAKVVSSVTPPTVLKGWVKVSCESRAARPGTQGLKALRRQGGAADGPKSQVEAD